MKSINKIIISLFILITLCSGIFLRTEKNKIVTLQAGKDASHVTLNQSADIISARLKLYGLKSFDVSVLPDPGQIKIRISDSESLSNIENLVCSKGELAFFETYTQEELKLKLHSDNMLFKFLNPLKDNKPSDPRVGCVDHENKKKAEDYVASSAMVADCILAWQSDSKQSEACLFALKTDNGNPLINRTGIESVGISDSDAGTKIMIKLNPSAAVIFAKATKANLNKAIAIVIDSKVYSWPIVRSVIAGGEIEVTGSFTADEAKCFPVIFNTGMLPLEFRVVK